MSMMKALRTAAPGWMTRWDFVIPANPALPATNANIRHYVEVKFGNDELTPNQRRARRMMSDDEREKVISLNPSEDCICVGTHGLVSGRAR